jgi:excisionase family DNA binding protein
MLTPKQAATQLGVSVSLVYQLCRQAVLRHYRIGGVGKRGRIVINEDDIRLYQTSCCREAAKAPIQLRHLSL